MSLDPGKHLVLGRVELQEMSVFSGVLMFMIFSLSIWFYSQNTVSLGTHLVRCADCGWWEGGGV